MTWGLWTHALSSGIQRVPGNGSQSQIYEAALSAILWPCWQHILVLTAQNYWANFPAAAQLVSKLTINTRKPLLQEVKLVLNISHRSFSHNLSISYGQPDTVDTALHTSYPFSHTIHSSTTGQPDTALNTNHILSPPTQYTTVNTVPGTQFGYRSMGYLPLGFRAFWVQDREGLYSDLIYTHSSSVIYSSLMS